MVFLFICGKRLWVCFMLLLVLNTGQVHNVLLNKCCDINKAIDVHGECVEEIKNKTTWYPPLAKSTTTNEFVKWNPNIRVTGMPCSKDMLFLNPLIYHPKLGYQDFFLYTNGSINIVYNNDTKYNNTIGPNFTGVYSDTSYCVDRLANTLRNIVYVCPCRERVCVRKCCFDNEVSDYFGRCFVPNDTHVDWIPEFYDERLKRELNSPQDTVIVHGFMDCPQMKLNTEQKQKLIYYLEDDGSVYIPHYTHKYTPELYCIEQFEDNGSLVEDVIICFPKSNDRQYVFYGTFLIISSVFLLATFLVYVLTPELMNLYGKTLASHVASLFFAYLFLAVNQLAGKDFYGVFCSFIAFTVQFTFLAAFFWLNVMCIDIWVGISGLGPLRGTEREREKRKFIYYSIYAWGSPLLISVLTAIMNYVPAIPDFMVKPEFGKSNCWFEGTDGILVYFYGPIACLLIANIIIFTMTTCRIISVKKQTAILTHKDSKINSTRANNVDRERMWLIVKLFIIMGVTWVTEVISWAILATTKTPNWVFYVTDLVNLLQGVLIFVIFVCKKKTRNLVMSRLACLKDVKIPKHRSTRGSSPTKSTSLSTAAELNTVREHQQV